MRTMEEINAEIDRRIEESQRYFPDAEREAYAYNLIQEALSAPGITYGERLDEIGRIVWAVRGGGING